MTKEQKLEILNDCYTQCLAEGKATNRKQFADLVGVNATTLSSAFNGNESYLTDSFVSKIVNSVKELELKEMFPSISDTKNLERIPTLPVIPTDAMAGTLGEFTASISEYDCERMVSPIKGADYAMKVNGDSMSPEFPNGSLILIKKVNEKAFIEWGKVYVLDTENGAVIKQIHRTENDGVVECVSLNPSYQPFTIDTSFINGWYRVLMVLATK